MYITDVRSQLDFSVRNNLITRNKLDFENKGIHTYTVLLSVNKNKNRLKYQIL